MKSRARLLTLLGVLGVSAAGCELAVDFDRSRIDGGALLDASFSDGPGSDGPGSDGTTSDAPGSDGRASDTGSDATRDQGAPDAGGPDATLDSAAPDADAGGRDGTAPADSGASDARADAVSPVDAGASDAGADAVSPADTGAPDSGVPSDAGVPDAPLPADSAAPDADADADAAPTDAADAALQCNTVSAAGAPAAPVNPVLGDPPALQGGTIVDGTYFATAGQRYHDPGATSGTTFTSVWVVSTTNGIATVQETYTDSVRQLTPTTRTFTLDGAGGQADAAADGGVTALETDICPAAAAFQASYEVRDDPDGGTRKYILYVAPPDAQGQTLLRTYWLQ